jgi:hypothetical protein
MDWQQLTALGIVAATAGIFAWQKFRRRKFNFERDTHCGCSGTGDSPTKNSIVFHARKGERSQVTVKMR